MPGQGERCGCKVTICAPVCNSKASLAARPLAPEAWMVFNRPSNKAS